MFTPISIREPIELKVGEKYKMMKKNNNGIHVAYEDVSFHSYTSSPEIIVIKTETGQALRIARYEIFETCKL